REHGALAQDQEVHITGQVLGDLAVPVLDDRLDLVAAVGRGLPDLLGIEVAVHDELVGLLGVVQGVGDLIAFDHGVALALLNHAADGAVLADAGDLELGLAAGVAAHGIGADGGAG